jgi:deoxyribonuclease (pyrimidine dimer)
MTRINLVPVYELSDQHLFAEYRELPRMSSFSIKTVQRKEAIPPEFTLNKGHMTFLLDKGPWLEQRHKEIIEELNFRGMNYTPKPPFSMPDRFGRSEWNPSNEEIAVSRARIRSKLVMKPSFYRWSNRKAPG